MNLYQSRYPRSAVSFHSVMDVQVTPHIVVEVTLDKYIMITDYLKNMSAVVDKTGGLAGVIHPRGRIFRDRYDVDIVSLFNPELKCAKITNGCIGVSNTTEGFKVTPDCILENPGEKYNFLETNFPRSIFNSSILYNPCYHISAIERLKESVTWKYYSLDHGSYVREWTINGIRVTKQPDYIVKVEHFNSNHKLMIDSINERVILSTPDLHIDVSGVGHYAEMEVDLGNHLSVVANSYKIEGRNRMQFGGYSETNKQYEFSM